MRKNRPAAVLVIAILHLVGGGLGVAGGLCGLAFVGAGGNQMFSGLGGAPSSQQGKGPESVQPRMMKHMEESLPHYQAVQYGNLGVDLLISVLMIVAGIGLIAMKSWGRLLSLVYAVLSILFHVWQLVYAYAYTIPTMNAFFDDEAARDKQVAAFASSMKTIMAVSPVMGAIVAIYPIIVIIIMLLPSVAAAFRQQQLTFDQPPDEYDQEGFRIDLRRQADDRIQPEDR
jgi:hypothetical protein